MTWTFEALYDYINRVLSERDRRYQDRFEAQERAMAAELAQVEAARAKSQARWGVVFGVAGIVIAMAALIVAFVAGG